MIGQLLDQAGNVLATLADNCRWYPPTRTRFEDMRRAAYLNVAFKPTGAPQHGTPGYRELTLAAERFGWKAIYEEKPEDEPLPPFAEY